MDMVIPPAVAAGALGDIEVLCRDANAPTPTFTPSSTPTASNTPLPTSTPRSSRTPTQEPTRTPRPTFTATTTLTPTPLPIPLWLPVVLREHCDAKHQRADIAVVIDTSSSMAGRKLTDAKIAAVAFVSMIDLEPGRAQVTVVRYDREAEVVQQLTRGEALIQAAIEGLQVRSGTHIDKGLRFGLAELQSPRAIEHNSKVLVLLTDGVQTGTPGEELRAAGEVRSAGVRLYAIGLGADVNEETLRMIAGSDERYYFAPDSGELARIYSEIAVDLMCPRMWGGQ